MPTRGEVEERWAALAAGRVTREEVYEWAFPWVEGEDADTPLEPLVRSGLEYLHGYYVLRQKTKHVPISEVTRMSRPV